MTLLIVEDSAPLAQLMRKHLQGQGYAVDVAADVGAANEAVTAKAYAGVLLDLGLPDEDGLSWLGRLRARGDGTPVIIVTALGGVADRVKGLAAGADDYVAKPFEMEELAARVRAILRRSSRMLGNRLTLGNVVLDVQARQLTVDGRECACPAREMTVLELLLRRVGDVMVKQYLEDQLFGLSKEAGPNTVEVYVYRLRRLLVAAGADIEIHTIRGVGYLMSGT